MLGTFFVLVGTFLGEISDSIGKLKVICHQESKHTMSFLSLFWVFIFFVIISLFKKDAFVFNLASLPTFSIRVFLEIIQLYISILAIIKADRSTFGFLRTFTLPLLLFVDIILGYKIGLFPIMGIVVIIATLAIFFFSKGIKKKGAGLTLFSSINAVATISLYKYDISHYNSVVAEQMIINLILLLSFFFLAFFKAKENPFVFLTKPIFLIQSMAVGLGGVFMSFSYNYNAASIITAAKRSLSIFWALLSGKLYFKEKYLAFKFAISALLIGGIVLLSM